MSQPSVAAGSCTAQAKDTPIVWKAKELLQGVNQEETATTKSSSSQLQPYTTHSFILPASITSVHTNAAGSNSTTAAAAANVGVSTLPTGPAPAPLPPPQQQPQLHAAPIAIAPFHGVIQHHHHPIIVAAAGPSPATTHPVGPGAAFPAIFMGPTPATYLIPHHHHPMPPIGGSSDHHHRASNKLRSGKWLPEEEEYAMLLVQLFEQGLLAGLEKGTTLRSFLARRLHCAPMRISKKFAGRGIGKMSYSHNKAALVLQTQQQQQQPPMILQKLQQTEDMFHRAIFPATAPRFSSPILHETRRSSSTPLVPMTTLLTPAQLAAAAAATAAGGVLPPFAQIPATAMTVAAATTKQLPMPVGSQGQSMVAVTPQPAFHPFPLGNTNTPFHTMLQQQQQLIIPQATNNNANTSAATAITQHPAPSSSVVAVAPMKTPTTTTSLAPPPPTPPATTTMLPPLPQPISAVDTTHDLLSGFDKVMQQTKQQLPSSTHTASSIVLEDDQMPPHSPPFTSQSFDDFHRFLGKDLTLLEEAVNDTTKTTAASTAPLFVAESYHMLRMDEAPAAFRLTAAAPTNELDAIDDVLDAVSSEPGLLHHHRSLLSSPSSTAAALVSEDGTNSSDSDTSAEGPVRKKTKTA